MPRDYWKWWWGGFAILLIGNLITGSLLKLEGTPAELISLVTIFIWVALATVGWRRNQTAPKNFAFKWSAAALSIYVVFSVAILLTSGEIGWVLLAIGGVWGIIWVIGGLAVIIIWLVNKSKTKVDQTPATKNCPYCAEMIQVAAIKCKHCGESLSSESSPA